MLAILVTSGPIAREPVPENAVLVLVPGRARVAAQAHCPARQERPRVRDNALWVGVGAGVWSLWRSGSVRLIIIVSRVFTNGVAQVPDSLCDDARVPAARVPLTRQSRHYPRYQWPLARFFFFPFLPC